jgi:hypothetical protein
VSGHTPHDRPVAAGKSSFDLVEPATVFPELGISPQTILLDVA